MLQVRDLSVEVGGRLTLVDASFSLRAGDTVGLVGRNGAGKTSLLKVLAGMDDPAAGLVVRARGLGFLPQDPRTSGVPDDITAMEHVLSGRHLEQAKQHLEKLRLAVEEDHSDRNVARFADAEERFRDEGGYAAESEAKAIASGLGLSEARLELPLRALSGGERRRLELTRILFAGDELLLLDEPTNHLDVDAKEWLIGFLRSYRGALLVVSHDLDLLDTAITRILHLDEGELVEYRGTYSEYREARAADELRRDKVAQRQEAEIKRLSAQADRMRGSTEKRARKAKVLDHRVERLSREKVDRGRSQRSIRVRLPEPPRPGETVLSVSDAAKAFGSNTIFEDVGFDVGRSERLLVLGLNGAGKTTLLRILAGEIEADLGEVNLGHNVAAGYYAQEHEGIVSGVSVLDHLRSAVPQLSDQQRRDLLGMFGLYGEMAFQDGATLSGGEKTKLALAMLCGGTHNLLLLDEPTNNLDPPSRTAVAEALRAWTGAMVLVSHDTEFVDALAPDRVLVMPDGTIDYWNDDYLDLVSLA